MENCSSRWTFSTFFISAKINMRKFLKLFFSLSAVLLLSGCGGDDDPVAGNYFDNAVIHLTVTDAVGKIINDSASLAMVTYYKGDEFILRGSDDPIFSEHIEQQDGQWRYAFVLNWMRPNTESLPGDNNYLLRDTLELGQTRYALEETLHVDVNQDHSRSDYYIRSLKVNGQEVASERHPGYWITLQAK